MRESDIDKFQWLLGIRRKFRNVGQLSWEVVQTEKRFPMDTLSTDDIQKLAAAYKDYTDRLREIVRALEEELSDGKEK